MTAARKLDLCSVETYLAEEIASPHKREYLGGVVYAMAGATNAHNAIAGNILVAIGSRLRGKKCRPYSSDTKIRIQFPTHTRLYYPDASVVCQSNPPGDQFQDNPVVVVEVLSSSTRRTDETEKRDAYLSIGSLAVYLLVEQSTPEVLLYRRQGKEFVREAYEGLDAVIPLPEIDAELPLAEVYEAIHFTPESDPALE